MVLKPVPMSRIAILGLRKYRQPAISLLHDSEVLQIEPLSKDVSTLLRNERDSEMTREISNQLLRVRALLTVLPRIPVTVSKRFESTNELLKACNSIDIDEKIATLEKEKETLLTERKDTENNLKLIEEFAFFPEDLKILQLSSANSYFGKISSDKFEEFKKVLQEYKQDIFFYSKEGKETTQLVLVVFLTFPSDAFANIIQTHDVKIETVPNIDGTPTDIIKIQKNNLDDINQKLKHIDEELNKISEKDFVNLVEIEEQLAIENKKLEVIANLGVTDDAFALEGWVPTPKLDQVTETLQKFSPGTTIYEIETEEKPPTLFNNPKRFFRLYEAFIRFYSIPQGKEFDPSIIFAVVFPIFYGLMIGDVGYCLIILLVCLWVLRRIEGGKRNMTIMPKPLRTFGLLILKKRQMAKLARAMIPGCIIGIVLGFIFDLYFGFHLNGYLFDILSTYGVTNLPPPGEILNRPSQAFLDPIHDVGTLLLMSGYVGIGMVSFGLILGVMNALREGEKREAIGKIGWLAFGWGVVLFGLAILHGELMDPMINNAMFAYFGLLIVGVGLMIGGEGPRSIIELPSIVSHILSYTRLIGILLASVILAHTIDFIFLKALDISIPFIILGTIILFIGHIFNTVIGVFEPGIQGARLIYVEFFSKFFKGNGRTFKPFGSVRKFTEDQYEPETVNLSKKKKSTEPKKDNS